MDPAILITLAKRENVSIVSSDMVLPFHSGSD